MGVTRGTREQVVTRWYRAPELLYGAKRYGAGIDVWACGCILAEMLLRNPLFPGEADLDQLSKIFTVTGTPDERSWPGVTQLPDYMAFKWMPGVPLQHIFTAADDECLQLLQSMLSLDPVQRLDCQRLLRLPFFSCPPAPTPPHLLPLPVTSAAAASASAADAGSKRRAVDASSAKRLLFD